MEETVSVEIIDEMTELIKEHVFNLSGRDEDTSYVLTMYIAMCFSEDISWSPRSCPIIANIPGGGIYLTKLINLILT